MSSREMEQPPGAGDPDDATLLAHVAAGDREAWETLVHRHGDAAFGVLRTMLRGEQDVEDALQDTFIRIRRYAGSYRTTRHGQNARGWVVRVAGRVALTMMRKQKTSDRHEAQVALREDESAEAGKAEKREAHDLLRTAVRQLPDHLRIPVVMHFAGELSQRDIARELQCPRSTVAEHIRQGLDRLRYRLNALGVSSVSALVPSAIGPSIHSDALPPQLLPRMLELLETEIAQSTRVAATGAHAGAAGIGKWVAGGMALLLAGIWGTNRYLEGNTGAVVATPDEAGKEIGDATTEENALKRQWTFENGVPAGFRFLGLPWRVRKGIHGAANRKTWFLYDAKNEPSEFVLPVTTPDRPFVLTIEFTRGDLDATVKNRILVWLGDEKRLLPYEYWGKGPQVTMPRKSIVKFQFWVDGRRALWRSTGPNHTSSRQTLLRYGDACDGGTISLSARNIAIRSIGIRTVTKQDLPADLTNFDDTRRKLGNSGRYPRESDAKPSP